MKLNELGIAGILYQAWIVVVYIVAAAFCLVWRRHYGYGWFRAAKKQDYRVTGRMYPIFLLLFGGTRFFLEFLRLNCKVFWGVSDLALWALAMVVIGAVWLIVDRRKARA